LFIKNKRREMLSPRIRELMENKEGTKQLKEEIKGINRLAKWSKKKVKARTEEGATILEMEKNGDWWCPKKKDEIEHWNEVLFGIGVLREKRMGR
jgi:hypothetical protein